MWKMQQDRGAWILSRNSSKIAPRMHQKQTAPQLKESHLSTSHNFYSNTCIIGSSRKQKLAFTHTGVVLHRWSGSNAKFTWRKWYQVWSSPRLASAASCTVSLSTTSWWEKETSRDLIQNCLLYCAISTSKSNLCHEPSRPNDIADLEGTRPLF